MQKKNNYWGLLQELAATDFKLKYQGSVIGYLWSLVKPLALFGILYLIFNVFVKVGSSLPHYPVYLLLGIVLWSYFADSTSSAMSSVVGKSDLIRKIYFPRIVIVLASSISALVTFVLNLLVVAVFLIVAGIHPNILWLIFPLLVVELYLLSLGVSLFLAALFVKYRDFSHIWELALQLLFYGSGILYPISIIPHAYQKLMIINPIAQIIQDSRYILIGPEAVTPFSIIHSLWALIPYVIPLLLSIAGYWYFERSARSFAEDI